MSDEDNEVKDTEVISEKLVKAISPKEEMANFTHEISNLMSELRITAMEAVIHYSQKHGIEIEVVAKLVNKDLKGVIKEEAASLNFLRYKNGKVIRPRKLSGRSAPKKGKKK